MSGNGSMDTKGATENIKGSKIENSITPEMQDIINAIDTYSQVHKNNVSIIASFWAFDDEKIKRDEEDVTVPGADRVFVFGDLATLRIDLNELRNLVEDNSDDNGFVDLGD